MKKRIFFIPGLGETARLKHSQEFIDLVKREYEVVSIILPYDKQFIFGRNSLFSDLVYKIKKEVLSHKPKSSDIIVGFSLGALFAYVLATEIKFKKALICSISAVLGEDTKLFTKTEMKFFTKEQLKELPKLKYKKPITEIIYFSASKEMNEMTQRPKKLHELYGGLNVSIGKWGHKFSGPYIKAVKNFL